VPTASDAAAPAFVGSESRVWEASMKKPLRVLLVEDSEEDAGLIERALRQGGLDPVMDRVETRDAMHAALDRQAWDVVIADHKMPRFSGLAALQLLQGSGIDLPFILVSGTIGEETAVAAMKAGAHDYVMKDNLARLAPAVERELQEAEVRRARGQAEQALQQRVEQLDKLNALSRRVSASLSPDQVMEAAREEIVEAIAPDLVVLYLRQQDQLRLQGAYPDTFECHIPGAKGAGECLCGRALSEGEAIYATRISDDPRCTRPECKQAGMRSFAALPLLKGANVLGVLGIASTRERDFGRQAAFLQAVAAEIAIGLQNALLHQQVQSHVSELEREVTQRKKAEDALRVSEERFRNIFEHSPIGIYQTTPDGRILMANPMLVRMLGYSSLAELAQRDLKSTDYFAGCSRSDFMQRIERDGQVIGFEAAWKKRDGSVLLVHENARVVHDEQENVLYYEGTAEDITERVQVEKERERLMKEIQEQAHRVQQIMDTVPEGVILLDNGGQVLSANPLGEVGLDTLAGASVGDTLTHLGDRPLAELLTFPEKGLWHEVETDALAFQVVARPIEDGPRSVGWVLLIRDVTQQRDIQQHVQRQERLAAVGQLAAGIAHDFNNIMATIVLYAQMAARSPELTDTTRARMRTINQQAQHAARLIQQILDFSRRSVLERQPFDLLPLFKEQVKMLERTLPENIEIKLDYGADEYTANADPTRMQQMLTNLALNARDAMPEGGTLRIGLERVRIAERRQAPLPEMGAGDWLKLVVSDTGTGIPSDALAHIYEPFFTTKEPGKGTGLGLSQVHGIVGAHEGHINVASRLNHGTTFTIYLPALSAPVLEEMGRDTHDLIHGKGETILVVEDNSAARAALMDSLEALNYRVLAAQNGEAALTMLEGRRDEIDLVVSDVVMPVMGGLPLLQTMQERGLEVKVILLTGHAFEQRLNGMPVGECPLLGGWLSKPIQIEELANTIAQALRE
jgi:two-component system cell cycle sensor histidine kinase/response regulator CckA